MLVLPIWMRWLVWCGFTIVWTKALLSPIPIDPAVSREHSTLLFYVHKTTHVAVYALYACLSAWIATSPRLRRCLLLFLLTHAVVVECGQNWVPGRYATLHDIGLNLVGISVGVLITRARWRKG